MSKPPVIRILFIFGLYLCLAVGLSAQDEGGGVVAKLIESGNLILALLINLLTTALFASRVYRPEAAPGLGVAVQLTAIPALAYSVFQIIDGGSPLQIIPSLLWTAFVVFDIIVNSIAKIEFRNPADWRILAPFLILFYTSTVSLWASTWANGLAPYLVTGGSYLLMAVFSIITRINEAKGSR
jgi:hypothetical protein